MAKQLRVPGHGLQYEGRVWRIGDRGFAVLYASERKGPGSARCSCGAESPLLSNTAARQRWHREHKAAVVAERQRRPAAVVPDLMAALEESLAAAREAIAKREAGR